LEQLGEMFDQGKTLSHVREVRVGDRWFQQSCYFVMENKRIRIYGLDITERITNQEELLRTSRRLRGIMEGISDGFFALDRHMTVTYFNVAAASLLGRKAEEVIGRKLFDAFPEARGSIFEERYTRALQSETAVAFETYFGVKPYVNWYDVRVYPFEDGISVFFQVITDRKLAEQALIESERELRRHRDELETLVRGRTAELQKATELLERIFSSIGVLIAYMDKDFNFIRVNRAYAAADQRTPGFYIGKNHFTLFPDADNEAIFRKVVETGQPFFTYQKPFEYAEHPERGITYWDWSLHPVKEPDGVVSGVVLTLVDVTERVRAQDKLRRNEQLLRTTMELLPVGLWITDQEGRIIQTNPAGLRIWAGAKYVGIDQFKEYKAWWADTGKLIEPEDWAVARAIRKRETSIDEELEIECFDGTHKIILNSAVPILTDQQKISGVVVVNQDITDRKRKEQLLEQSESRLHQLSSQLIAVQEAERKRIAREIHDGIGQSLSAIKFRIESILQQKGKWKEKEKSLEELVPLIRECIDESRRVQMDLRPSMIDDLGILPTISWFCREFHQIFTTIHIEKHLRLQEQDVPDSLKIVLFRMLQEAMNNVAKHGNATCVDLYLRKVDDSVELVLQDNGLGFDLREVLSRSGTDRGLGLASMRERAELSGGAFTIDSAPGKGTKIRAAWPLLGRSAEPHA
jgi:PAS domain S-box-containing protein